MGVSQGEVFVHLFQKVAGVRGQSPCGLSLTVKANFPRAAKGRRSQRKERRTTSNGPQTPERRNRSAAKDAGRAIPLSWEITDFPTHGEPQTVCRSVAALEFP